MRTASSQDCAALQDRDRWASWMRSVCGDIARPPEAAIPWAVAEHALPSKRREATIMIESCRIPQPWPPTDVAAPQKPQPLGANIHICNHSLRMGEPLLTSVLKCQEEREERPPLRNRIAAAVTRGAGGLQNGNAQPSDELLHRRRRMVAVAGLPIEGNGFRPGVEGDGIHAPGARPLLQRSSRHGRRRFRAASPVTRSST